MDNQYVTQLLDILNTELEDEIIESDLYLYAFKTSAITNNSNAHISLEYKFYDTQMKKVHVKTAIQNVLSYFKSKWLGKDTTTYTPYNVNNPAKTIDFLEIIKLNFSDPTIKDGSDPSIESNNYKVNHFMESLEKNYAIAHSKKDYKGLRYTVFKYTSDTNSLLIINKNSPLYKPRNLLFSFDLPEDPDNTAEFKPIFKDLFKIPFYPSLIILNNHCFMIEKDIESIFGFEEYNKKLRIKSLAQIKALPSLEEDSFKMINSYANKGTNHNLFATFEPDRVARIQQKNPEILENLKSIGIEFSSSDKLIVNSENEAQNFLNFVCATIKSDLDTGELCIAAKSSLLE